MTDGDGLSSEERRLWRSQLALTAIVDTLDALPTFWRAVDRVRNATDPAATALQEARIYGIGGRRRFVADLMQRAATSPYPVDAMLDSRVRAVTSQPETRRQRRSTYRIGPAFVAPLQAGADALARKGCGEPITEAEERSIRRLFAQALAP